jgi:hypothetical protein
MRPLQQSGMIHTTIILYNQKVKTEKVVKATGGKQKQLFCIDEYRYNMGLAEK